MHRAIAAGVMMAFCIAHADDSFTGCWPITPLDAKQFIRPSFNEFRIAPKFHRQPAPVDLTSHPEARTYRTVLRRGAKEGPNFADHFTIVGWGCGSSCAQIAIVDAATGGVYFPALEHPHENGISTVHVTEAPGEREPPYIALRFRRESSLLVILGGGNDENAEEGIAYYRWDGSTLHRIRYLRSEKHGCASW